MRAYVRHNPMVNEYEVYTDDGRVLGAFVKSDNAEAWSAYMNGLISFVPIEKMSLLTEKTSEHIEKCAKVLNHNAIKNAFKKFEARESAKELYKDMDPYIDMLKKEDEILMINKSHPRRESNMKMVIEFREVDILDAIADRVMNAVGLPIDITKIQIKRVGGGMNEDPTFGATIEIEIPHTTDPITPTKEKK